MTAQVAATGADPIASHIAGLRRRLYGPRHLKSDILREVQHGLLDAAEGHEADGVPAAEAARRAVDEFGDPADIARQFQTELAARQARFTLAFLAVLGPVMEVSSRIMWSNSPVPDQSQPDVAYVLAQVQDVAAWTVSVVACLALVAIGLGSRLLMFRSWFARVVAYGLAGKLAFTVASGTALTMMFDHGPPQGAAGVFADLFIPASAALGMYLAWLAWRCWRVAQRADELTAS